MKPDSTQWRWLLDLQPVPAMADDGGDDGLEEWLAAMASCPRCWEVPCAGCCAGGVCDAHCHCGERTETGAY